MQFKLSKSRLSGSIRIPGSKSHTIRAVLLASLAEGTSVLEAPLASADTEAAIRVYSSLGASVSAGETNWSITGIGQHVSPSVKSLDVANSGTTLRVAMGTLSLMRDGEVTLTGDAQIQSRPGIPLVNALNDLGANVQSVNGNGCAPFTVQGTLRGGHTSVECKTSQYLTSLMLACPFAENDSEISVPLLYERAYVGITADWLSYVGIHVDSEDDYSHVRIPGGQRLKAFSRAIPADFSTASFFLVAGALSGNSVTSIGLDMTDSQPDKAVVNYLKAMGATVTEGHREITVTANNLKGCELDLNDTPDALPIMAVAGCFAEGETRLVNVPQARIKETDRIAVMCTELRKMGADIEELEDGLIIRQSRLKGAAVDGHHDHRVVMSLAIAATQVDSPTTIDTAEAAAVTVPEFKHLMTRLGADIHINDEK